MSIENPRFNQFPSENEPSESFTPDKVIQYVDKNQALPSLNQEDRQRIEDGMTQEDVLAYYDAASLIEPKKRQEILDSWLPRPKELYHGTYRQEKLEELTPKDETKRDSNEPPQVFGTPSKVEAMKYLVKHDDSFVRMGAISTDEDPEKGRRSYMTIYDAKRFEDTGGWIYTLPPDSFDVKLEHGEGLYEWTSPTTVKPTKAEYYPPGHGLQALIDAGVEVRVSDMETLAKLDSLEVDSEEWRNLLHATPPLRNAAELEKYT